MVNIFPPGVPYSQFWSRWFPDQRTEPKTQLLRLASVKNYKSYVILELHRRFHELSPMNKEHQRLGVSRYSLVYVYCFFAQLRKFLKLRLHFPGYLVDGVTVLLSSSSWFLLQRHPGGNAKASHGEATHSQVPRDGHGPDKSTSSPVFPIFFGTF